MDISQIANATNQITGLSNLILVSPQEVVGYQPQNPDGSKVALPPAILFHTEAENTVSLESDITDHYIENNTAIQDHIALKPEQITVRGFIGELNDVVPPKLRPLKIAAEKLTAIGGFMPQLSESALIAYNQAWYTYNVAANAVTSAVSTYNTISNSINGVQSQNVISADGINLSRTQTKQQQAFTQFYGYWAERRLFSVQTPWAIFQNMAIQSLRAMQDAETAVITDFEITFKMIRYAKVQPKIRTVGRLNNQSASLADLGTSTPSPWKQMRVTDLIREME